MVDSVRGEILRVINSSDDELTVKDLSDKLDFSYSTVLKWVDVLFAEGEIIVRDFKNIKLVKRKNNER
jgi:predicted ArsR family transcriptional regulator